MNKMEKVGRWILPVSRLLRAFIVFFKNKIVHVVLFFTVNVVIGSLGVWMPILASLARPDVLAYSELIKALSAGGPYTFAVAYLAGTSSFLVYEYLDEETTANRRWKTSLGIAAFLLIVLCTQLSAFQTKPELNGRNGGTPTPSPLAEDCSTENHAAQHSPKEPVAKDGQAPKQELDMSEQVQLDMTFLAVIVGLGLFVVSRLGDADLKEQFATIYRKDAEASEGLALRAANTTNDQLKL